MSLFKNSAIQAWKTLGKVITFFKKLTVAKSNKLDYDEKRILDLSETQNRSPNSYPTFNEIQKNKERILIFKKLSENIPQNYNPNKYFQSLINILADLNRTAEGFDLNEIYTFKYIGETPGWYDLNPVTMVTKASGSYFEGVNFHWKDAASYVQSPYRKYRFDRVQSKFYRINPDELDYILRIPTFYPCSVKPRHL